MEEEEPLIIYDSQRSSRRSGAPVSPLTFNLSGNQRVCSLIMACGRTRLLSLPPPPPPPLNHNSVLILINTYLYARYTIARVWLVNMLGVGRKELVE